LSAASEQKMKNGGCRNDSVDFCFALGTSTATELWSSEENSAGVRRRACEMML
jgi:hypothetical protein